MATKTKRKALPKRAAKTTTAKIARKATAVRKTVRKAAKSAARSIDGAMKSTRTAARKATRSVGKAVSGTKKTAKKIDAKKSPARQVVAQKTTPKPVQEAVGAGLVKEIRRAISNIPGFGPAIKATR